MSREIMQQSLKLLIAYQDCTMDSYITNKCGLTIQALKQELAKPEQIITPISPDQYERFCGKCGACLGKPWVGLTDAQISLMISSHISLTDMCRAIEAKLKEKNNGSV